MADGQADIRKHSSGKGKGKAKYTPKGRQIDDRAMDQVRALLGDQPRQDDALIEYLHLIQDTYGCLHHEHLTALSEELGTPLARVYETATFYAHFDVIKEGETSPKPITVRVCDSITCSMYGGEQQLETMKQRFGGRARVVRAPCMGRCCDAPVAEVGHNPIDNVTPDKVGKAIAHGRLEPEIPDYKALEEYEEEGGYKEYRAWRRGERKPEDLEAELQKADLRGMGGAGFPTFKKIKFTRAEQRKPRYVAINADEGEPGTFKDRYFMETDPHRVIEGTLIAAAAIEAERVYYYLRDEYPACLKIFDYEVRKLEERGIVEPGFFVVRRGAGAYICGEESGMVESIEGKRGYPRHKPPFTAQVGVFGQPSLTNNVETMYWLMRIVEEGGDWFARQGRHGCTGLRAFSLSGRVKSPGVKICPAGTTARELVEEFGGGMAEGERFKAYLPGGASGGILPESMADIPMHFGKMEQYEAFTGSGAVVIVSDRDRIQDVVLNLMRFFEDESCGQCTPCRVGTEKAVKLMEREVWDEALLQELNRVMLDASICGLGQAAPNPVKAALTHFRDELSLREAAQ